MKYLFDRAQENNGTIKLDDIESVYHDFVFNGLGEIKENPIHTVIEEARPKVGKLDGLGLFDNRPFTKSTRIRALAPKGPIILLDTYHFLFASQREQKPVLLSRLCCLQGLDIFIITKASVPFVEARQDDLIKEIMVPWELWH